MTIPIMTQLPVAVIGSGIAGTVAALALQKAGLSPHVYEARSSAPVTEGAFLTLAVNGVEALAELGLDARTFGGFDTPRFALELGDGTCLAEMPNGPVNAHGVSQTIRRADLYAALRAAAEARGIPIHYGKKLETVTPDGDGVCIAFADGARVVASFAVGADGLHSKVRSLLDPATPRYLGLLNAGGFARGVALDGAPGTMHFVFGKRCFLGWVKHPTSGEVWWFANPAHAKEPTREELAAIDWRAELLDLFADDATPGCALVRASEEIFTGWPTYDLPKVRKWHDGRTVIIGDAAHAASPSSGQGASMAIEDAVVLGACVRDAASAAAAFDAYERARRKRVERIVAHGRRNGTGKTPGSVGRVVRDAVLRLVFRNPRQLADPSAWIYEERVRWDAAA